MADLTTGELRAVAVGDLPLAPDIYDETKIPVEQNGESMHMTGAQWKAYAQAVFNAGYDAIVADVLAKIPVAEELMV